MLLSIVIVNWNSKEHLRRCLDTVRGTCAELSPQVVVVDNGSFDGCGEMVRAHFPEVEFRQSEQHLGFGRANNFGFEAVRGEKLLLLNPDTELTTNAVSILTNELARLGKAGLLGARLLNSDGSLQTSCVQSLPTPLNEALDSELFRRLFPKSRLWGTFDAFSSDQPVEVEAVSGACMCMWTETFRRVGGFSPEYFMYGEDMDLCSKIRRLGLKIYHVPAARIVHRGGGSSNNQSTRFSVVWMREAIYRFICQDQGIAAGFSYRLLMTLSSFIRLILLLPALLVARREKRAVRSESLQKWLAILRWSTGREKRVIKFA